MARHVQEDYQLYFSRLRPIFHQLFNLAHAITGSSEMAEYCLQYAMLDCWASGDASASRHGFREGLRGSSMKAALRIAGTEDVELDWDGLGARENETDPLLRAIAQEPLELRRMLALRYGCGLSPRRIAKLMKTDSARVQTLTRRFDARVRNRLSAGDRRRADSLLAQAIRGRLSEPSPLAPEMNNVFRTFQSDAATISPSHHLPVRILRGILVAILALICVVGFWLAAVLIQPPVLDTNASQQAVAETVVE